MFVGNKMLWILYFVFFITSAIAVYSASATEIINSYGSSSSNPALKHILFYFIGFVAVWCISRLTPYSIRKFGTFLYLAGMLLLLALLFIKPINLNGATRWVSFFGISLQPSEFYKLSLPLFGAFIAFWVHKSPMLYKVNYSIYFAWVLMGFIIFGKESASTGIFIGVYTFIYTLIMRVRWSYLWRVYIAGAVLALLGLGLLFVVPKEYLPSRLGTWTNRLEGMGQEIPTDRFEDNVRQAQYSQIAIANSGITGVGPGHSKIKEVLPMANSDFIFAIIIEEFGVFGLLWVSALYVALLITIGLMAQREKSLYRRLLILGIGILIPMQALVNMAVVAAIFMTGQTLPLISVGGSSLITSSIAFGILLSISNQQGKAKQLTQEAAKHGIELDEQRVAITN